MIKNIGTQLDKIATHIATLGLGFPVYSGRPIIAPAGKYAFFQMTGNSERIGDDSVGIIKKRADFDFFFFAGKETPDVEVYEMLDALSNAFCTLIPGSSLLLPAVSPTFKILSIQESTQSGVLRDVNQVPYVIGGYTIAYNYLYP